MSEITDGYLYLILAGCPSCDWENRIVERRPNPVPLDMDVEIGASHCDQCGYHVGVWGDEWDIHAEYEIEIVQPTQERQ